jgi:trans-aconitate methyltransferase
MTWYTALSHPQASSCFERENAAFNTEFHSQQELESKFLLLEKLFEHRPLNVLDLGGGNGLFSDQLLARFPKSVVTILDVSSLLLANNVPSNRKELRHGSIEHMSDIFAGAHIRLHHGELGFPSFGRQRLSD